LPQLAATPSGAADGSSRMTPEVSSFAPAYPARPDLPGTFMTGRGLY
jgi:hypothetical protein